jgi:hypothetical protein
MQHLTPPYGTYVQKIFGKIEGDFDKNLFSYIRQLDTEMNNLYFIRGDLSCKGFTIQASYKNRCSGKYRTGTDWQYTVHGDKRDL